MFGNPYDLDNGHHKTTEYWAVRALIPAWGYTPVDTDGKVHGFAVCMPERQEAVCSKRKKDYERHSLSRTDKLPIWC